jgi:hypothetical protein
MVSFARKTTEDPELHGEKKLPLLLLRVLCDLRG